MTGHTITMTAEGLEVLRIGNGTVSTVDSTGRSVVLFPQELFDSPASKPQKLIAVLSKRDLDLIEQTPEGWGVADTTRTTGWTIHVGRTQ